MLQKHFIYVDSSNRVSGDDSNFQYEVKWPPDKIYDRVVVLSALIPKSFYLISAPNNTFTLREGATSVTITVPSGDYVLTAWKTVLGSLLTTNSPNGWVYSVTSDNIATSANRGLLIFTVTGNTSQPSIILGSNKIHTKLGFHPDTTNTFVANTITSTHVIKLQVEDSIYICSDIVESSSNSIFNNILQDIHAAASPDYGTIVYQCNAPEANSKRLKSGKSSIYTFCVTNSDGEVIDFNGISVNFTILCYKKDDINDKIRDYMKLTLLQN